jgi:hypothetical protein
VKRLLSGVAAAALLAIAFPCLLKISTARAIAQGALSTCLFSSTKWVNPVTDDSGSQYEVMVTNNAMSCTQATGWAKKFISQQIGGAPGSHSTLKGPAGYDCVGFPDKGGHAYRGRCQKPGDNVTGFNWGAKP